MSRSAKRVDAIAQARLDEAKQEDLRAKEVARFKGLKNPTNVNRMEHAAKLAGIDRELADIRKTIHKRKSGGGGGGFLGWVAGMLGL